MKAGSILPKFSIGITDNFMLGISFGVSNFIGDGNMKKNRSYPEIQIKYRIFDETDKMPAILMGIDTQGRGKFLNKHLSIPLNRYEQKSYGLYFVSIVLRHEFQRALILSLSFFDSNNESAADTT